MIFTAAISGVSPAPEIYGGVDAASAYVGAMFGPSPTAWLAMSGDDKGRTLVTATRYLDAQAWDGTATGLSSSDATTLQFPRSGLKRNGADVDATSVPPEVTQAAFELAVLIAADPEVVAAVDAGSNVSSVAGGGGVSVSFFSSTSARQGTATQMPVVVQRLLGRFLASADSAGIEGGIAQTGCSTSAMARCRQFNLVGPE